MAFIPGKLLASLRGLDQFEADAFTAAHEAAAEPVSLRFNPGKTSDGPSEASFRFPLAGRVPWAGEGWYLAQRPSFTHDPLFHAGLYYVQEASSMFLEFALKSIVGSGKPVMALDLCAAPGGKSTSLQAVLPAGSLVVSNEVIRNRVPPLYQNIVKWGAPASVVSQNDPADFQRLPGFFDLLVVDAPCSGSGLFRKDPAAAGLWSEDLVNLCSQRQQRILADAWATLKENGLLVYCTCSYSPAENESVVDRWLDGGEASSVRLSPDPAWGIVETRTEKHSGYGYRFYPDKVRGEGFFLSVLRRISAAPAPKRGKVAGAGNQRKSLDGIPEGWVPGRPAFLAINEMLHAVPPHLTAATDALRAALYLKKAGILCGKAGSGEWIPDHELALAAGTGIPRIEVDREDALLFLRKELERVPGTARGWQGIAFSGHPLGWIKQLPNRLNNYYPTSWRILH